MQTEGYIHSIETFGTLDGPGLRYVIFMQGCPLRCKFCHNPDTWSMANGQKRNVDWLVEDIRNYIPYFHSSGGGVTASGGEPLLQAAFLSVLFSRLKKLSIHTVVDTSGFAEVEKVKELMSLTNLVMLSIKHPDPHHHREICGQSDDRPMAFARYLNKINMPVWIRYVLIPGITDSHHDLKLLAELIIRFPNIVKLELLPYHTMGVSKWKALGLESNLLDSPPPTPDQVKEAQELLTAALSGIKVV